MARGGPLALAALVAACGGPPPAPAPVPPPRPEVEVPAPDPLPSWTDGATKQAILEFVDAVTTEGGPDFVPVAERIAVFDNDGTLWAEQPYYFQLAFALDRVEALAPEHPEWATTPPFQAALEGDVAGVVKGGHQALFDLVGATHGGVTTEAFDAVARSWLATARHPTKDLPYTELVYAPMLEVLELLRDHDFQTWIVSGGGQSFLRAFAPEVYGIPPEQIVGTTLELSWQEGDDGPGLQVEPEVHFVDDGPGKPVAIQRFIGRRPLAAFGNSDGDLQMIQWTTAGAGRRLGVYLHHTDGEREWAYDRDSHVGRLDRGLDLAPEAGWVVVDMARDWTRVFPAP